MKQHDFNYGILDETAHRPWPMPSSSWIMTQTWHNLLFAHWPLDPPALRPLVPAAFDLDLFDGRAWVAVVPFQMTNVAPRGVPALPWVSEFPELNVRTYVRVNGRAGVYFFSLDAANPVAVVLARTLVHLPYFTADMDIQVGDGNSWVAYRSRRKRARTSAELAVRYRPVGPATAPREGTLEYFLTERYCLFTVSPGLRAPAYGSVSPGLKAPAYTYSLDIHHPPWPLQPGEAEFAVNTMADASGIRLPASAPLLHFARRQDMVAWGLRRIHCNDE